MSETQFLSRIRGRWSCALILAACFIGQVAGADELSDSRLVAARSAVNEYGAALKAALGGALATGDLTAAVDVCAGKAPQIAATVSRQSGMTIGRTSERTRNPANRPTDWQQAVLSDWETDIESGLDITKHEYFAVQPDGVIRYMRPIFIQPACLTCHGETLSADVQAILDIRYPTDRATGYRLGDLRGAFVAQK